MFCCGNDGLFIIQNILSFLNCLSFLCFMGEEITLEQKLTAIGEVILGFPDFFENGLSFPLDSNSFKKARTLITKELCSDVEEFLNSLDDLYSKEEIESMIFDEDQVIDTSDLVFVDAIKEKNCTADASLARRLYGHDVRGLCSLVGFAFNPFRAHYKTGAKAPHTLKKTNDFHYYFSIFRLFCSSMAFLATHDEKYNFPIPIQQVAYIIKDRINMKDKINNGLTGNISASDFVTFFQFATNAHKKGRGINFYQEGDYAVMSIADKGKGIREKIEYGPAPTYKKIYGAPLPVERIPELFEDFTTHVYDGEKTGGLGLQIAKRLADLTGRYITVKTKAGRGQTLFYDTRETEAVISKERMRQGTEFKLYIPMSQLQL